MNEKQATSNQQPATASNLEPRTSNLEPQTSNLEPFTQLIPFIHKAESLNRVKYYQKSEDF
jgi:hypothetical protein